MSGQQHSPAALYPRKDPVPIVQEAGWSPGPVWTGGKSRPHRDFFFLYFMNLFTALCWYTLVINWKQESHSVSFCLRCFCLPIRPPINLLASTLPGSIWGVAVRHSNPNLDPWLGMYAAACRVLHWSNQWLIIVSLHSHAYDGQVVSQNLSSFMRLIQLPLWSLHEVNEVL